MFVEKAEDFLKEYLKDGPKTTDDIFKTGNYKHDLAKRHLRQARKSLGVKSNSWEENGEKVWYWSLPPDINKPKETGELETKTAAQLKKEKEDN